MLREGKFLGFNLHLNVQVWPILSHEIVDILMYPNLELEKRLYLVGTVCASLSLKHLRKYMPLGSSSDAQAAF